MLHCHILKHVSLLTQIQGALSAATPAFLQKADILKPANKLASLESATSGDAKINEQLKDVGMRAMIIASLFIK